MIVVLTGSPDVILPKGNSTLPPALVTELANSGVSVADATAASAAAVTSPVAPVSTDVDDLRHQLELCKETINSMLVLLTPFHRDLSGLTLL